MPVIYGGKKIIPVQGVSINKKYLRTDDNSQKIGTIFSIVINGTLASFKGSPNGSGVFWTAAGYPPDDTITADEQHFERIMRKQEAIRTLFAQDGLALEIQPFNAGAPISCYPRVLGVNTPEGIWHDKCPYTVELEADVLLIAGAAYGGEDGGDIFNYKINRASEDWQIDLADENNRTYKLTHQISAVGKAYYDSNGLTQPPWRNAKDYVLNKLQMGISTEHMQSSGVLNLQTYSAYNYVRGEQKNELAGSYAINESWVLNTTSSSGVIEEYTVNMSVSAEAGRARVGVDGTIRGLEVRGEANYNTPSGTLVSKWMNASGYFSLLEPTLKSRAESITGYTLNSSPVQKTIARNINFGVITYNYEFDDRPLNSISGAFSESFSITDDNQGAVHAEFGIPGRTAGPFLQDVNTKTAKSRTFNIEAVFPLGTLSAAAPTKPDTSGIVINNQPVYTTKLFRKNDQESFNRNTGRYTRNVTWIYE